MFVFSPHLYYLDVGDWVEAEEEIVQVETDKVTHSVFSPTAGVIVELMGSEGDTV